MIEIIDYTLALPSMPFGPFAGFAIAAALGAGSNYLAARKQAKAQREAERINNMRLKAERQAQLNEQMANDAARSQQQLDEIAARQRGHEGRDEGFQLLQKAGDEEQDARDRFAKALGDFGVETKKAKLEDAKQKRSGRVSKAVKGAKITGTLGGAGRGAIRTAGKAAVGKALDKAADTSSAAAALGAYGTDLAREMEKYGELVSQGRASGLFAQGYRNTANARERLANQDMSLGLSAAAGRAQSQLNRNRWLGPGLALPPDYRQTIDPNTGMLELVGGLANAYGNYSAAQGINGPGTSEYWVDKYSDPYRRTY